MINFIRTYGQYLLLLISLLLISLINLFELYSNIVIPILYYTRELLTVFAMWLSYNSWKKSGTYREANVIYLLKSFSFSIIILIAVIVMKYIFFKNAQFQGFFPYKAITPEALVYSTLQGAVLIFLLPLIVVYIWQLYVYKRKASTPVYFRLFVFMAIISSLVLAKNSDEIPNLISQEWGLKEILFRITIFYTFILSFRHKWIPFLTKKQKYTFALMSLVVIPLLIVIFDQLTVPTAAFSLTLLNFFNHLWFFIIFYGINSMIALWMQLPTAHQFEKKLIDLTSIHEASRTLNSLSYDAHYMKNVLTESLRIGKAEDIWIELDGNPENGKKHQIFAAKSDSDVLADFLLYSGHKKISEEVKSQQKPVLIEDVKIHPVYSSYFNWRNSIRSLIACPLISSEKKIFGIIYAIHSEPYFYDLAQLEIFESYVAQLSLSLENSKLIEELLEKEKYKQELKIAREVQIHLLPSEIPSIPPFEVSFETLTASEVGGDFYDVFKFKDGLTGLILGDVSGKGTQAAFYMAEFKGIIQAVSTMCNSPYELATLANKILYQHIEKKVFITGIIIKIDPQSKIIQMVRAGHTHPVLLDYTLSSYKELESRGIGMGLNAGPLFDQSLQEIEIPFQNHQCLFLYTDGLSELRNEQGKEFDFPELLSHLKDKKYKQYTVWELHDEILQEVYQFMGTENLNDDVSFILLKTKSEDV